MRSFSRKPVKIWHGNLHAIFSNQQFACNLLVALLYLAYVWASTRLWLVDNHNDFGEYFTRAELWSRGQFVFSGGSDKLLSIIEVASIYFFPHNFFVTYTCLKIAIITILFCSIFAFLNSKAALLPSQWVRTVVCLIVLLHPVFFVSAVTVDESVVFTAMLLLFISSYNRPFLSVFFAILCLYARPEGLLVIPLFFLLAALSEGRARRQVAKSALVALAAFTVLKFVETAIFPLTREQNLFLSGFTQPFSSLLRNIAIIPVIPAVTAAEVFPQLIVFGLFLLGAVLCVKRKKYAPFTGILLFHSCLIAGLFWSENLTIEDRLVAAAGNLSWWVHSLTLDLQKPYEFGWPRYYLFDYPALATYVVAGANAIWSGVKQAFGNWVTKQTSSTQWLIASAATLMLGGVLALAYGQGYQDLLLSGEYFWPQNVSPINQAGMAIRARHRGDDEAVLFDDLCDSTEGSMPSEFSVHSGVLRKFMRICEGTGAYANRYQEGLQTVTPAGDLISSNKVSQLDSDRRVVMMDYIVDTMQTSRDATSGDFDRLFSMERAALIKANVRFIVTNRTDLQVDWLEALGQFGPYHVYIVSGE